MSGKGTGCCPGLNLWIGGVYGLFLTSHHSTPLTRILFLLCLQVRSVLCHLVPQQLPMGLCFVKMSLGKLQASSSASSCVARASTVPLPARHPSVTRGSGAGSRLPLCSRPARVCLIWSDLIWSNQLGLGEGSEQCKQCKNQLLSQNYCVNNTHSYKVVAKLRCRRWVLSSAIFTSDSWLAPVPETVPLACHNRAINSYSIFMQIFLVS